MFLGFYDEKRSLYILKLQKFGFTKTKAYGLCGAVLASMLFATAQVSADEMAPSTTGAATEQVATQTIVEPATGDLTNAIDQASAVNADVVQEANQTVTDQAAAQADYAAQAEAIHAAVEAKVQEIAAYEAEKAAIEAENAAIAQRNAEKKAAYEQALAEAEANKDKDGYLSKVVAQDLVFDKESNARVTISGQYANLSVESTNGQDKVGNIFYLNSNHFSEKDFVAEPILSDTINEGADQGQSYKVLIKKDQPVTVVYDSLENSYFMGRQITKVVYTYTARDIPNKNDLVTAYIFKDPTNTIKLGSNLAGGETAYDFVAEFYFLDGSKVEFSKGSALISLSSLNAASDNTSFNPSSDPKAPSIYREYVSDIAGGDFIKITGSSVDMHNGSVYSDTNNAALADQWDKEDSDFAYYGAGALKLTGDRVAFTFGGTNDINQLFSFNSRVKATGIPVTPTYETEKPLPTAPEKLVVTYYLNEYNHVLTTVKDVIKDGVSINNGTLKLGESGTYSLTGAFLSKDRLEKAITQYDFEDLLDTEHDKYTGYKVYAFIPIKLKDGTVLETKADLAAYAKQTYDESNGRFYVSLNSDFLASVADDSDFQVGIDIQFERIKTGTVENTFTNIVNGQRVVSNTVVTHTPSEPDPETPAPDQPKPETPIEEAPVAQQSVALPKTGENGSWIVVASGLGMAVFGLVSIRKRKN